MPLLGFANQLVSKALQHTWVAGLLLLLLATQVSALDYELKGVDDDTLSENIELHLANVTLGDKGVLNNTLRNSIVNTVNKAIQPYGYYNGEIDVNMTEDNELVISVTLNSPLLVSHVTREIIGAARFDNEFKKRFDNFPMKQGDVLIQPTYESFKASMFNYALSHGYFDFQWQATRLDLVREENEANVVLIAQSGKQYLFGPLQITGDDRASAIIQRLKPFETGEKYTSEKLTEFNRRLNQTGYFARVIARPLVVEADKQGQVPIEVTLAHLPRDIFNVGGGASTDTKGRLRARWERPWVNTRGHSVSAQLYVSKPEQLASIDYRIPLQDVNNDYASFQTSYQFEDNKNSDTKSETLSVSAHRFWREEASNWQRSVSLTFEREMFTQGASDPQTISLLMPGYSISYLDADSQLNTTEGQYYLISMQGGYEGVGSDISLLKATANGKIITTLNDTHRFMFRASLGVIETDEFDRVPSSLRFFTGGDQSVRGFRYQAISPSVIDSEGEEVLTGGRYLATASIEYAYPVATNWRAAVFFDVGTASNDLTEDPATGVGIGAHWITLIGPVRFYIARGNNDYESQWEFHFTIGPEL